MECETGDAAVSVELKVPSFDSYKAEKGAQILSCDKQIKVHSVTSLFRISLNLFADGRIETNSFRYHTLCNPVARSPAARVQSDRTRGREYGGIKDIIYSQDRDPDSWSPNTRSAPSSTSDTRIKDSFGDHLDVTIEISCLKSNIHPNIHQKIKICSTILNRQEQFRELQFRRSSDFSCWSGVLVPRISLRSYGLLRAGALHAVITFTMPSQMLQQCRDGVTPLTDDMKQLLSNSHNSADAVLVTSDGGRLPCHLAIMKARSSLLSSGKILNYCANDISIMVDGRSPVSKQILKDRNCIFEKSNSARHINLEDGKTFNHNQLDAPSKCKTSCIPRVNSRSSAANSESLCDLDECFIEGGDTMSAFINNSSETSMKSKLSSDLKVLQGYDLKENFNGQKLSDNISTNIEESDKVLIQVNMTTSVAQQFLEWIYTGECGKMDTFAQQLLACGRRFAVPSLLAAAEAQLIAGLSPKDAATALVLAHIHQAPALLERALLCAKQNLAVVMQSSDWEQAIKKYPELALKFTRIISEA